MRRRLLDIALRTTAVLTREVPRTPVRAFTATFATRCDHMRRTTRAHATDRKEPPPPASAQPVGSTASEETTSTSSSANARKDLYMMFTGAKCETRAARGFSRQAFENGVVIVTCPGCQVKHVIADRMGWFGEPGSVEDFIAQKTKDGGQSKARATRGSLQLVEGEDGTLEIDENELKEWLKTFTSKKA